MSRAGRGIFAALALVMLAGCATGGTTPETSSDILALQARVLDLQRKAAVTEVELARLRQQVAALDARQAPTAATPIPAIPSTPAVAPVRPVVAKPIEEQDLEEPSAPSSPATEARAAAPAQQISAEGQGAYDEAYALFHQGRYVDAESAFQRFLQNNPRTDLTDNAFYWIGESRFARGDLRGALAAFRQTVESYPAGNKVPDALLKAGQCLQALGDADGAKASFEEIVRRFPDAAAAVVARERLDAMP